MSKPVALVVEDMPLVAETTKSMLEQELGFEAIVANTGEEAVKMLDSSAHTFDVAIVDYNLPGMNGGAVAAHIRKHRPAVRIIICTGYLHDAMASKIRFVSDAVLAKPFCIEELELKLKP
jgi:CheY-like chemotaxis protein